MGGWPWSSRAASCSQRWRSVQAGQRFKLCIEVYARVADFSYTHAPDQRDAPAGTDLTNLAIPDLKVPAKQGWLLAASRAGLDPTWLALPSERLAMTSVPLRSRRQAARSIPRDPETNRE